MKDSGSKILIVEDDQTLMMGLTESLKHNGYEVIQAANGQDGLRLAQETKPDLVLLDLMLPGMSGFEVCRQLREAGNNVPVIMLTARQDEFDKVHGFEVGADDYVTKPFSLQELLARVKAVMARGRARREGPTRYEFGDCVLDMEARILTRKNKSVPLTKTEFDLLAYFCANEGKALSREAIMNDVWGMEYYGTQRSIDSFVASLRSKMEEKPGRPVHITTVHGVGYKFMKNG